MRGLLVVVMVLATASVQAQAPTLAAILQQAKATTAAALKVMQATPEYQAYEASLRTERALEARIAAEAKPGKEGP